MSCYIGIPSGFPVDDRIHRTSKIQRKWTVKKTGFEKAESRMKKFWTISIALHNVRSIKGKCMGVYTCKTQDSSVGKATRYGLDGQGIESRWGARFSAPVQTGPPSLLFNGYRVSSPGALATHPPIYRRSWRKSTAVPLLPLWAFVAFSRVTFTFTF